MNALGIKGMALKTAAWTGVFCCVDRPLGPGWDGLARLAGGPRCAGPFAAALLLVLLQAVNARMRGLQCRRVLPSLELLTDVGESFRRVVGVR